MSVRIRDLLMEQLDALRHEPIDKRIRATLGGETVIDSRRALLVWEPRRIVPSYAVPVEDVDGEIAATPAGDRAAPAADDIAAPQLSGRRVLDPSIPFRIHTAEGEPAAIRAHGGGGEAA